jgi:DNA-binding SARP family transcriptional activator
MPSYGPRQATKPVSATPITADREWPVFVCLLGSFMLLKAGEPVLLPARGKVEMLLSELALGPRLGVGRDDLLAAVWPSAQFTSASHSFHTLLYSLHQQYSDVLAGHAPVVRIGGGYRLNVESGVGVDITAFETAADAGEVAHRKGDRALVTTAFARAARLYRGDLSAGEEVRHVLFRERLRMRYITLQATLADYQYSDGDYPAALARSLDLLQHDPCREDAHRLVIRCYVRLGERAQALRQFHVCRNILRSEFEAEPEQATIALYEQVRLNPAEV